VFPANNAAAAQPTIEDTFFLNAEKKMNKAWRRLFPVKNYNLSLNIKNDNRRLSKYKKTIS